MSTDSAADAALLVEIYQSLQLSLFCDAAVNGLLAFDWILTLRDEVRFVWANPTKLSALLYFGGRYMPLVQRSLNMISVYPLSDTTTSAEHTHSCYAVFWTTTCAGLIFYVVPIIFSANRAYALSDRNKLLFCIVFVLSAGPLVINMINTILWLRPVNLPAPLLCSSSASTPPSLNLNDPGLQTILLAIGHHRHPRHLESDLRGAQAARGVVKAPIAQALLFNGGLYFITLLILNITHIIMSALSLKAFLVTTSYIAIFIDPLTSVLTSRFLLDLQRMTQTTQQPSRFDALSLSLHMSFVGVGVGVGVGHGDDHDFRSPTRTLRFAPSVSTSQYPSSASDIDVDEGRDSVAPRIHLEALSASSSIHAGGREPQKDKVDWTGAAGKEPAEV
ncbi:hypothetical protein C8Q79DRAFT_1008819 [Trametes meyenii]|nr:hypothetical protein C8Q79DRAFT_1008819 [Trametes meyenii]